MSANGTIVVGVDESAGSVDALREAVAEAARRASRLRVVWAFVPSSEFAGRYNVPIPLSDDEVARNLEEQLRQTVDRELPDSATSDSVEVVARPGSAARVLVDESRNADLLVVGHRGRGGIASTLLGSVGLQCVLHAHCPVLVVRPHVL